MENKKKSIVTIALVMVLLVGIGFLGYFTGKEISKSGNNKSETAAVSKTENTNNDSSSNDSNVQEAADLSGADEQADVNTEKVAEGGSTEQVTSQTENEAGTEAADNSEAAEEIAEKSEAATENDAEKVAAANDGKGNTDKDSGKKDSDKKNSDSKDGKSSKGLSIKVSADNSWGDNPVYNQLAIIVSNDTEKVVEGWTAKIDVGDATIDSGWSGNYSIEKGVLTVTNVDYNGTIGPGQSVDAGVILGGITGNLTASVAAGKLTEVADSSYYQNNNQNNNQNNGNNGNNGNQQVNTGMLEVPKATTNDWLHTDGRKILDANGNEVWLTGCNWFGYNTGTNTFDGLWASDLNTSIKGIADHGFNIVRIPISAELLLQWKEGKAPTANFNNATNFYLVGMDSLEIFDYVVGQFRANGLKIMIDIHSAKTDAAGHNYNVWYNGDITTEKFQESLCWLAERYKNDDTILILDLKNEPHGKPDEGDKAAIWNDSKAQNNWKYAAEETAKKVLKINPNLLVAVEGIEIYPMDLKTNSDYSSKDKTEYYFNWWGGNLRGVADYPIDLGKNQDQLIYSPHDYGPTVYQQPWFSGDYDYDSLMKDCWHDNWFYIYEQNLAPLLIGEWGGYMSKPNITWMTYMRELISKYRLNHTFWCYNANSGDTGGLVKDDFTTWDEEKYNFVKEVLWQNKSGKFIGLDHDIPLGTAGNGISLGDYYKK